MHRISLSLAFGLAFLSFAPRGYAVEYTKVCSQVGGQILGPGFYYLPGTDSCFNPTTGDMVKPVLETDMVTIDVWKTRAEDRSYDRLRPLPHLSRRTRRFLGPINGLVVDG